MYKVLRGLPSMESVFQGHLLFRLQDCFGGDVRETARGYFGRGSFDGKALMPFNCVGIHQAILTPVKFDKNPSVLVFKVWVT